MSGANVHIENYRQAIKEFLTMVQLDVLHHGLQILRDPNLIDKMLHMEHPWQPLIAH